VVKSIGFFVMLLLPGALLAQSPKSAVGGEAGLWAGAEFSDFNPDFICASNVVFNCADDLVGPTALFDFNLTSKIGAEGEARWLRWNGASNQKESNYLLGPRYRVWRHSRVSLWVKGVAGGGWITTPNYPRAGSLQGSYLAYGLGGTVDYRLSRRLILRADYEYQIWPSFAGPVTYSATGAPIYHNSGLSPNGVSVGVNYRFFGH
jgi:hypothetical protein